MPRTPAALLVAAFAASACAADFAGVDPAVFGPDDPRTKTLPRMMEADAGRRLKEANERESKAFAAVTTKEQWEKYRDERVRRAARARSGELSRGAAGQAQSCVRPAPFDGDGFKIVQNLVYESPARDSG